LRFSFLVENAALHQLVKQESELRSLVLASVCVLRATPVTRPAACRSYFGDSSSFNDGPAKRSFLAVKAQEFIPCMHVVIGAEIPTGKKSHALQGTKCPCSNVSHVQPGKQIPLGLAFNHSLDSPACLLVRFDHVVLTDLTHFRIFPRNLEPDFTHYLCEQRKENGNL
jgi:hypothetical protein